jgi:hypothetical protein
MPNSDVKPHVELVGNILHKLEFFISKNMEILFKEADEALFNSAQSATSINIQNNTFEFMNILREQKENIQESFVTEFNIYLQPVAEVNELPKKRHRNQSAQLGLIEQDEMDEMVLLKTISSKSAMNLQEELSHLGARFEHLALKNKSIFYGKALHPQHICDAFQECISFIDLPSESKLTLFKMFGEFFVGQLKTLYDELNQLLIEDGILPQIELTGKISKTEDRNYPHSEKGGDEKHTEAPVNAPQRQGSASGAVYDGAHGGGAQYSGGSAGGGTQQTGGFAGGGAQQAGGSAGGVGAQQAGGSAGGVGAQQAGGSAGGGTGTGSADQAPPAGGDRVSAGRPIAQINQSIQGFVGGKPSDSDGALPAGVGGGFYSHSDVVSALSNIQFNEELLPDTNLGFDAGAIKKALLTAIGESKGGVVDKRVNHVSEKTIDFIKLIFDAIIDDKGISDTIKTLLLSLQIPIIKAAMIDADFFIDDQHPARQLLDKLAEAGVGVVDHQDPVYIEVEKIVRKLLADYKEDICAFEDALIALTELTEGIYSKAREQEEVSQQEIKHRNARSVVLKEIRKVTLGKELPVKIRTLVLKVWPSLMFNHFLRNGKANDEWVEMLMILDRIIDSVQPLGSLAELEELGFSSDDIVNAAREKLNKCRKSRDIIDRVIDDLKATYENLLASREALEQQSDTEEKTLDVKAQEPAKEQVSVATEIEPEVELTAEAEAEETAQQITKRKIDSLPEDVQPGSWYILYNGEDKPVRRLKLAVILVQDATLVFVDHLGNVVIEKDAEVFADELEKGLSGIIMRHSVFDYALNSALDSIRQ